MREEMEENERDVEQRTKELKGMAQKAERMADTAEAVADNAGKLKSIFCCQDYNASVRLYGGLMGAALLVVSK